MIKGLTLLLLLTTPLAGQERSDTVTVESVEDTVPVRQIEPITVEQDKTVRLAMILMPLLITVFGGWQTYQTRKLELGQTKATNANLAAAEKADAVGVRADAAATNAAELVAVVRGTASETVEGIRALIVQSGEIHDLVNGDLRHYKELAKSLAVNDAVLRKQILALGLKPEVDEVEDVRVRPNATGA